MCGLRGAAGFEEPRVLQRFVVGCTVGKESSMGEETVKIRRELQERSDLHRKSAATSTV